MGHSSEEDHSCLVVGRRLAEDTEVRRTEAGRRCSSLGWTSWLCARRWDVSAYCAWPQGLAGLLFREDLYRNAVVRSP